MQLEGTGKVKGKRECTEGNLPPLKLRSAVCDTPEHYFSKCGPQDSLHPN